VGYQSGKKFYKIYLETLEERDPLKDSDVDGKIILQLLLKKLDVDWIRMVHDKA
jgi:hypothetical protein